MQTEYYSMPDGCIYYRVPEAFCNVDSIVSLRQRQAVLLRTRENEYLCNYVIGDHKLRDFLQTTSRKVLCEIEFISLKSHSFGFGRRFPLWNGSTIGMNGSISMRANDATPKIFAALLRDICVDRQQLLPDEFFDNIAENALHILGSEILEFAKQENYGAEMIIQNQVKLTEKINKQLPITIVDGVKMVTPLTIQGMIL